MVKYIVFALVFLSFMSCKYKEQKATYSVIEVDSSRLQNNTDYNSDKLLLNK